MIILPILTCIFLGVIVHSHFRSSEPDSYDAWLAEPNDPHLEIVE